jgi:hypothetical protein
MTIFANSTSAGQIIFGDETSDVAGAIQYFHSDNSLRFKTDATEAARFDSSGNFLIPDNNDIKIGTGEDLGLGHDGTNSIIYNTEGDLRFIQYKDDKMIRFYNDNGSGGTVEYFRVDGASEETVFSKQLRFIDDANLKVGSSGDLTLYSNNANTHYDHYNLDAVFRHFGTDKDFIWYTTTSGTTSEILRLDGSTGNVGINQSSPSSTYKLDVGGSVRLATAAPSLVFRETDSSNQEFSLFGLGGDFYIRDITNSTYPFVVRSGADNSTLVISSNSRIGIATTSPSANADLTLGNGELCMAETTTPTADANFGKIYCKSDNKLYFQDGAGTEHEIAFV